MTEKNVAWLPIVRIEPDPIERVLRILWTYQDRPIRFITSQRYSLAVTEPLPNVRSAHA